MSIPRRVISRKGILEQLIVMHHRGAQHATQIPLLNLSQRCIEVRTSHHTPIMLTAATGNRPLKWTSPGASGQRRMFRFPVQI